MSIGNELDKGFLSLLSQVGSTRTVHSTQSHHQASFHLSMRHTIMRKTETQITLNSHPTPLFFFLHIPSLINTHIVCNPPRFVPPPPSVTPLTWQTEHLELIQQSQMPPLLSFASHSSAPVRSHSRLACILKMGLSGNRILPFRNGIIEN